MNQLTRYREEISCLDRQLIDLVSRRFLICLQVAEYKKNNDIPMMQHGRVTEVIDAGKAYGRKKRVDEAFIEKLYGLIISEACRIEDEYMCGEKSDHFAEIKRQIEKGKEKNENTDNR